MKQRILSFVLAVCMIAVAIPAMAFPVVAAENRKSFTTTMEPGGENWPTYVSKGTGRAPVYHNGWSAGRYEAGVYQEFDRWTKVNSSWGQLTYQNLMWMTNGVFLYNDGRAVLMKGTADEGATGSPGPGAYYGVIGLNGKPANTQAFTYTYTVPYNGVVDLSITSLAFDAQWDPKFEEDAASKKREAYLAIFVNDKMIWPTDGGSITNPADWERWIDPDNKEDAKIEDDVLKNLKVSRGDTIRFAAARINCATIKYTPSITYHDDYDIAPAEKLETYSPQSVTWPSYRNTDGVASLKQKDNNWTLGQFDTEANAFTAFMRQKREGSEAWAAAVNDPDFRANNGIIITAAFKNIIGAMIVGTEETNLKPAYEYKALATGTASLGFTKDFMLIDADFGSAKNATAVIGFYKNGESIGTVTITTDEQGVATASEALAAVKLTKGDKVDFVVTQVSEGVKQVRIQPVVQYTDIVSFIAQETTDKYVLAMDAASIIVGDKIALSFSAYGTRDVYQDSKAGDVKLLIWDAAVTGEKTKENATAVVDLEADIMTDYAYNCVYEEFAPKQMTDTITVQAYLEIDGEQKCISQPQEVSLASVAFAQYEKAVADEDEKQINLMVAVLNYGAAAQQYFGYRVDDLANKNLPAELQTVEQKPDGTYSSAIMDSVDPDVTNYADSEITSASLVFESTIGIRVYVDVAPGEATYQLGIRYGDSTDVDTFKSKEGVPVDESNAFTMSGIGLLDLKKTYYFQAVVQYPTKLGKQEILRPYSANIFTYSVESYVARMAYEADKPELANLLHALMALSDAAVVANK